MLSILYHNHTYRLLPNHTINPLSTSPAKTYTFAHASMYDTSKQCANDNFRDGITNGNMWYKVFNGMQDWSYVDMDCFEVTIELGCCKYPSGMR